MNVADTIISQTPHNFVTGDGDIFLSLAKVSNGTYITAIYHQDDNLIAVHAVVKQ